MPNKATDSVYWQPNQLVREGKWSIGNQREQNKMNKIVQSFDRITPDQEILFSFLVNWFDQFDLH